MRLFIIMMLIISSPIWPIGEELLPGDPLIIVNKRTNELVLVDHGRIIIETKVATGKTNDLTPEGLFTITVKAKQPYYRKQNIQGAIQKIRSDRDGSVLMLKAPMAGFMGYMVRICHLRSVNIFR